MEMIASFGGPINLIPFSFNLVANSAFSDRKPYPGWTAWAPVFSYFKNEGMKKENFKITH
jgi:hypothetical protein